MQREPTQIFEDQDHLIGEGTFGRVYKIQENGQFFALKTIDKTLIKRHRKLGQLKRQVQILKNIRHENVVGFVSFFQSDNFYNLKMEYCEGRNLKSLLLSDYYRKAIMPNPKYFSTKVSLDILHALAQIRNSLVSNRDIKPDNVIVQVDEDFRVSAKIVDFGEAKFHIKEASSRVGTLGYMAPEVQAGRPYTEACDCWSLGISLYEIFQGIRQEWEEQKSISCPFSEQFKMALHSEYVYYNQLIWKSEICLTKSKTPKPFRQIIRGLLNPDADKRMTLKQAIDILIDQFDEISQCLHPEEIELQKRKLIESQALQKHTAYKREEISSSIKSINILYNTLLIPLSQSLSQKNYGKMADIAKLMLVLINKIQMHLFFVMDTMQISAEYLFYDILTDVMNDSKRKQFEDLRHGIENSFKLLKISFNQDQFKLTQEIEAYLTSEFPPSLLSNLKHCLNGL